MTRRERRDLFAAHAMQGLLASDPVALDYRAGFLTSKELAEQAVVFAEAMLAELDRRDDGDRKRDPEQGP